MGIAPQYVIGAFFLVTINNTNQLIDVSAVCFYRNYHLLCEIRIETEGTEVI